MRSGERVVAVLSDAATAAGSSPAASAIVAAAVALST